MILTQLRVIDFRCYDNIVITDLDHRFNVIYGQNGQGKTSLLEAIYLLTTYKSFRGAKNNEMLRHGMSAAFIQGTVLSDDLNYSLEIKIHGNRKQALLNQKPCKLLSEYVNKVSSVCFSPNDLEIIRGTPELRRNWIDKVAATHDINYINTLVDYQKALDQRNKLLKHLKERGQFLKTDEIDVWDQAIAEHGAKIILFRMKICKEFEPKIEQQYSQITNRKNLIKIQYFHTNIDEEVTRQNHQKHDSFLSLETLRDSLKKRLGSTFQRDMALGSTSVGPHRDDLHFKLDGHSLRTFGSQGEVRSLALAMRLSEVETIKELRGHSPILLIDDFSSELDLSRRTFLLDYLTKCGSQVVLTTTERLNLGKSFKVSEGRIDLDGSEHTVHGYNQQL